MIVVKDIEKSKQFYKELFGLDVILDQEGNVILTEGLVDVYKRQLKSRAEYAILPAADFLGQGREGHINTPGTVGSPNWEWRMPEFEKIQKELQKYKKMIMFR